jgi:hypothetical protein
MQNSHYWAYLQILVCSIQLLQQRSEETLQARISDNAAEVQPGTSACSVGVLMYRTSLTCFYFGGYLTTLYLNEAPCGGGLEYLHRSPASRRRRWKGNPVPERGLLVTGGHKYRDLVLQVGGWKQGWRPCSVEKLLLRNPKKWKRIKSGRTF